MTAYAGTPAWRARVASSNATVPASVSLVEARLGDHDGARGAHPRVEARVERTSACAPSTGSAPIGHGSTCQPPSRRPSAIAAHTRLASRRPPNGRAAIRSVREITIGHPSSNGAKKAEPAAIDVCGQEVRVSNPEKPFFPERGLTKLDLVNYYVECAEAVVRGLRDRPTVLKRWVDGVQGKPFFQKRVPDSAPEWLQTTVVTFPSGRHARELVPNDAAHLVWGVNLGVIDWNPWAVRRSDLDHPDELRVDLDPQPEVPFSEVREVALCVRDVLDEHGLLGFPKTSGSRGIHIYVRLSPEHDFLQVRTAALALAREVERRMPGRATSRWWKEEREGVFIDYNQNARDRTIASAYSVRAVPDARVSCPLEWDEVADVEPDRADARDGAGAAEAARRSGG